jgi:hypothetical protein
LWRTATGPEGRIRTARERKRSGWRRLRPGRVWQTRSTVKSFHEKTGECQVGLCFSSPCFLRLSQAASVDVLPSALFVSDYLSVPVGRPRFSRCCYLIIDLGSTLLRELGRINPRLEVKPSHPHAALRLCIRRQC